MLFVSADRLDTPFSVWMLPYVWKEDDIIKILRISNYTSWYFLYLCWYFHKVSINISQHPPKHSEWFVEWEKGLLNPYLVIQTVREIFKIVSRKITARDNREEWRTIKAALDSLKGGTTFDIFAESEDEN